MIGVDEPFRLLDVYFEIASTVEEGVFAVDLDDVKIVGCEDGVLPELGVGSSHGIDEGRLSD